MSEVFSLRAFLGLDSSEYEKGLDKALSAGSALGSGLATAASVGLKAVTAATTAVVGFGTASVATGQEFDRSMSQVAATMGDKADDMVEYNGNTVSSMEALRDFAQEMGRTTAFSATQAADALNYMALAGYDAETSINMLPNVLNLAAAGSIDLARASDMITDTQTAFGISLERTSLMVDEMAKAASTGNTSVEQLGDAFLTVGGLAQELNGGLITLDDGSVHAVDGIQELEIALTAMANAGIKGSEAGTHMRNMLLKLSSPTSDGAIALEQLGVSVFDTEGNMRSLQEVFGDLSIALGDLTQEQKIQAISDLFNTRDLASAEALLNAVSQDWDNIGQAIIGAWGDVDSFNQAFTEILGGEDAFNGMIKGLKELGISQEAYDEMLKTSNGDAELFVEGLLEAADAGVTMEDLLNTMGGDLSVVEEAFNNTTGAAQQMADTQLDNLAGDITLFQSALEGAKIAVSDKLTPSLRDFVQFGTDGLSRLTDAFQTGGLDAAMETFGEILADGLNMIIEKLPSFIDAGIQLLGALGQGILDNLPVIIDAAVQILQQLITSFVENLPMLVEGALQILLGLAMGIAEMLPTLIPTIVDVVITIVETLIDNVDLLVDASIALIIGLAEGLINALPRLIEKAPEIIMKLVSALIENVPKLNEAAKELIFGLAKGLISFVGKLGETALELILSFCQAVVDLEERVKESAVDIMKGFAGGILGFLSEAGQWGKDLIDNFISGIKGKINDVVNTCKDIAGTIADYLGFSEPEKGPLSDFHTYAPDMIDLFTSGLEDSKAQLEDTLNNVLSIPAINLDDNISYNQNRGSAGSADMMDMIAQALSGMMVQVNIGNEALDGMISKSIQRTAYVSGGR